MWNQGLFVNLLLRTIAAGRQCCVETSSHDLQWAAYSQTPTYEIQLFKSYLAVQILLGAAQGKYLQNSSSNSMYCLFEELRFLVSGWSIQSWIFRAAQDRPTSGVPSAYLELVLKGPCHLESSMLVTLAIPLTYPIYLEPVEPAFQNQCHRAKW